MRKANTLLTFLGTGNYQTGKYSIAGQKSDDVPFVQEALLSLASEYFSEPNDEVIVLLTKEARAKNYESFNARVSSVISGKGLKCALRYIEIPTCANEKEIWQMFEILCTTVREDSVVHIDITHSFRFMPSMAIVFLDYARTVLKTEPGHIWYGAFEAKNLNNNNGVSPIFDFSDFTVLQRWNGAVASFMESGDSELLKDVLTDVLKPQFSDPKSTPQTARIQKKIAGHLNSFTQDIKTVRGESLYTGKSAKCIANDLQQLENEYDNILSPLKRLLNLINAKISPFTESSILNGLEAARWCKEYDLIQQGITILQETHISFLLDQLQLPYKDQEFRHTVSSLFYLTGEKKLDDIIAMEELKASRKDLAPLILKHPLYRDLASVYCSLRNVRNDINHGGIVTSSKTQKLQSALGSAIEKSEKLYSSYRRN